LKIHDLKNRILRLRPRSRKSRKSRLNCCVRGPDGGAPIINEPTFLGKRIGCVDPVAIAEIERRLANFNRLCDRWWLPIEEILQRMRLANRRQDYCPFNPETGHVSDNSMSYVEIDAREPGTSEVRRERLHVCAACGRLFWREVEDV